MHVEGRAIGLLVPGFVVSFLSRPGISMVIGRLVLQQVLGGVYSWCCEVRVLGFPANGGMVCTRGALCNSDPFMRRGSLWGSQTSEFGVLLPWLSVATLRGSSCVRSIQLIISSVNPRSLSFEIIEHYSRQRAESGWHLLHVLQIVARLMARLLRFAMANCTAPSEYVGRATCAPRACASRPSHVRSCLWLLARSRLWAKADVVRVWESLAPFASMRCGHETYWSHLP
ncbi:hypothetical protein TcWFU_007891 [Taenia crassiceps]|uniref:Secreted protein n=1 Tax=Taenia crassiceps TaxID=6207 RepID=A0ABR4QMN1_9CEST